MRIGIDAGPLRHTLTGIGWYLSRIIEHLPADAGQDDELLLYASRPLTTVPASSLPLHLRVGRSRLPGSFWLQWRAPRMIAEDRLDCFWGPSHFLPISLPPGIRRVLTVHDIVHMLYPGSMARYSALVHRMYFGRSLACADAIITVSEQTKHDLISRLGIAESRVSVVHEAADGVFRPLSPALVGERRVALGVSGDYILAVGTIEPRKNYPLLFRALARLPEGFSLLVAGRRGWKCRQTLSEVARLGIGHRVRFLDYIPTDDLVALYCGALCLVMPSIYEGFGLPVLQAMACGTPVLASNCSSLPEVGGDAAAYFDPASVESLAAGISGIIRNEPRRNQMRESGLRRARLFTWQRAAAQTLAVLHGHPGSESLPVQPNQG